MCHELFTEKNVRFSTFQLGYCLLQGLCKDIPVQLDQFLVVEVVQCTIEDHSCVHLSEGNGAHFCQSPCLPGHVGDIGLKIVHAGGLFPNTPFHCDLEVPYLLLKLHKGIASGVVTPKTWILSTWSAS